MIGAGPAGSRAAGRLARAGHEVRLFDRSFDREKPCGGGVPWCGLGQLTSLGASIRRVLFEGPGGRTAEVTLPRPIAVYSRRALDRALVEASQSAGAVPVERRVIGLAREGGAWRIALDGSRSAEADHVVGADGARSVVRRALGAPFASEDLSQAVGWYVPGRTSDTMRIRFDARIPGYLWIFPRPDHLAVGACAPLRDGIAETLWESARDLLKTLGLSEEALPRYSALIPSLRPSSLKANRVAGPGWSLVGDAAGTVDPLTREGIRHGVRSADLLGSAFERAVPLAYGTLWKEAFLPELSWAASRRDRFFEPDLTERLVRYIDRSRSIRRIMVDPILGRQSYLSLKRRLLRAALPAGLELALSKALSSL